MRNIQQYLVSQRAEMIALTEKLVNIDSPSTHLAGIKQVATVLSEKMQSLGMQIRQIDQGKPGMVLVGELAGVKDQAPVILSGHLDTVFPVGTATARPFKVVGDKMLGPGVYDMKAGLVIGLFAIQALQRVSLLKRPLKMIIVSDEEKLHFDSRAAAIMAQEVTGGAYGLNLEGAAKCTQISTHQRGGMIIDITVHGKAAHSGVEPQKGRSAILELADKLPKLAALTDMTQGIHVNCGMISGGISENIIPDRAKVSLGVRFKTEKQRKELLAKIIQLTQEHLVLDTTTEVTVRTKIDSMEETKQVKQLFADLKQTAQRVNLLTLEAVGDSGASDAGIMVTNGVPCLDGVGVVGDGAHTDQEFAKVSSMIERASLLAEFIMEQE